MPSPVEVLLKRKGFGTLPVLRGGGSSIPELQQQAAELEQQVQATGAPGIEEDKPGIFRTIIDVLSRPNYAIAGAADELFQGKSMSAAIARAGREFFSGVGGLEGDKEAWGEVLEQAGVGTKTLSDVFPFLDNTWVGNFGSRGALGIGLDILTDPLTYVTFGAKAGLQIGTKAGKHFLSREGAETFAKLVNPTGGATKFTDDLFKNAEDTFLKLYIDPATGKAMKGAEGLFQEGGARFMGAHIPGTEKVYPWMQSNVRAALTRVPGGPNAMEGASQFYDGARSVFSAFEKLVPLGKNSRAVAESLHRKAANVSALHRAPMLSELDDINMAYSKMLKADGDLGQKFYEIREKTTMHQLTPEQQGIYDRLAAMNDNIFKTEEAVGILDAEQMLKGYFRHSYENAEDFNEIWAAWKGEMPSGSLPQFTKERQFITHKEAKEISKRLNSISEALKERGVISQSYPELIPDYDIIKNTRIRINNHGDAMARQAWTEDAKAIFGKEIADDFNINVLYDLQKPFITGGDEYNKISKYVDNYTSFGSMAETGRKASMFSPSQVDTFRAAILQLDLDDITKAGRIPGRAAREDVGALERARQRGERVRGAADSKRSAQAERERQRGFKSKGLSKASDTQRASKTVESYLADLVRNGEPWGASQVLAARDILAKRRGAAENALRRLDEGLVRTGKQAAKLDLKPFTPISKGGGISMFMEDVDDLARTLSPDGKRELFRQLLIRTKSESQLASLQRTFAKHPEAFPDYRAIRPGDAEPFMREHYGEGAKYVTRVGKFWGEKPVLIPQAIAEDIESFSSKLINTKDHKAFGKLLRGFDKANNWFKVGVYTLWPASATRDAYSNIALSMLDIGVGALDPKMHAASVAIMGGRLNGVLKAKNGVEYGYKELRKMSRDMGVWVPGEVFIEATGGGAGIGRTMKKAARIRATIENEARVQLWLNNVRRGMNPRDAADRVAEFLFNYGEVSQVEREVFRRLIPFYTFTRKNVELQAKMLVRKPGLVLNQVKPFRGYESENEQMVSWEAEGLKIRLDRDGKTVHMLNGIDLPLRNLDTLWAGGVGETGRRIMGMVTPLIKTPIEMITGRDFFTGGDMKRARGDTLGRAIKHAPKPVQNWLGYKEEFDQAGRPSYTFDGTRYALLVKSWAFSRVFSTSDRQFREYAGDANISGALLDFMTGIRDKDINLDESKKRLLKRRIRQLEQSLVRRGEMREFTRPYTPKEQ